MDFPGFHVDGSALTALLVLLNTAVNALVLMKVRQTHDAVNGMQVTKVEEAHQAGVVEGAAATGAPRE